MQFLFSKRFFEVTEIRIPACLGERLWQQEGNKKNQFKADRWVSFCADLIFYTNVAEIMSNRNDDFDW